MTQLMVHGQKVETVFELLGNNENAMTYSLGWALANSGSFCHALAELLSIEGGFTDAMHIRLQDHAHEKGFTDIEVIDPGKHHIIIEAKRGFTVPSMAQLEKYADRLLATNDANAKPLLVVLAESDRDETWLNLNVPKSVKAIPVQSISWRRFQKMATMSSISASHAEKRLLSELVEYLGKVTMMQNQYSNLVYVVALGDSFEGIPITPIDVVEVYHKYFHPVGNRWPVEPPNYIAFRYHGILQSIHHITSYKVIEDFQADFKLPSPCPAWAKSYLYELGAAITPSKEVRTFDKLKGFSQIQRSARCYCFLDLLLTCDSVSEAWFLTGERTKCYEKIMGPE